MLFHAVDAAPVASVAMPENIMRNEASLAVVHPGIPLTVRFSVANYSVKELPAGKVKLSLPAGWSADRKESVTDGLAPGKLKDIEFKITPPPFASGESLACMNFLWNQVTASVPWLPNTYRFQTQKQKKNKKKVLLFRESCAIIIVTIQ
jgi:hypothetical protein